MRCWRHEDEDAPARTGPRGPGCGTRHCRVVRAVVPPVYDIRRHTRRAVGWTVDGAAWQRGCPCVRGSGVFPAGRRAGGE